ncbi:MAG TPA: tagaturonate epimerase family protein [Acidobacteriaceae bacterium]|nr:tagaturonate epimerase family protein [Acidobacteriaceae bacterium]
MSGQGAELGKFSVGVGDRFAHQAKGQLRACILAAQAGVEVIPVWNKSNREHNIIGSEPDSARAAADAAVKALGWQKPYFCDADHINLTTVDRFLSSCDFYTIDVADAIGRPASSSSIETFVKQRGALAGNLQLEAVSAPIEITPELLRATAEKFLFAVQDAGKVYRKIEAAKGKGNFIAEVSMDETDSAQTPAELLIILAAIADEGIPVQTIAPKFTGRFNKGVDYAGSVEQFRREIQLDVAAIAWAVRHFGLPRNLKLSIHSGSDKFSIYAAIHEATKRSGVHLKTAGTTWLEEIIGLAEAGGDGLALVKEICAEAWAHRDELCGPYATVIDIDPAKLPAPATVAGWNSEQFTSALRHDPCSPAYNSSFRQLLHVGFKVAAKMGHRYLDLLEANEAVIAKNVTENLFDRHIAPVFLGKPAPSAILEHAETK